MPFKIFLKLLNNFIIFDLLNFNISETILLSYKIAYRLLFFNKKAKRKTNP